MALNKSAAVIEGTGKRLTDFGAFIGIASIDGLVHISQISHKRIKRCS